MKVSLRMANLYSNVDLVAITPGEIITRIGAQLGAVEEVIDWGTRYDKIVVGKIVTCTQHPNADKLRVCLVDDGGVTTGVDRNAAGQVQVVCGAPNAREGILVAWLPPGSTVPSSIDKDPFVLGARELRGVVSNGMLASPSELGLSDDHDGILEIDPQPTDNPKDAARIKPGLPFKQLYNLDDVIIDCENKMFTHRPDCFGILGVAREIAGITGQKFVSPDWYSLSASHQEVSADAKLSLASKNDVVDKVPRFMAQVVENITVGPSTMAVQSFLTRLGSRPINNIVDATNYYMLLTAQPTHAFDYDKVKALCLDGDKEVIIFPRMAKDGERIDLLNGKAITLTAQDIVIATDKQAIALGGVMGGAATEVDANTKNIIIECANFDMYTIRRTSMRHGLFTDAVTRFNKGQSHLQNPVVLRMLTADICKQTQGTAGVLVDSAPEEDSFTWEPVSVEVSFINERLGSTLSAQDIQKLLTNVEFTVELDGDTLVITPPFWRKDIEIGEDIVEEVGRLYGYDKLTIALPRRSTAAVAKNADIEFKTRLRNTLARFGANEVLTYSFVSGKLLESVNQSTKEAYQLANALSPELQYYRLTLTPSLLSKTYQNIRAGYDQFALFEIGKTHLKLQGVTDQGVPVENDMLGFVFAKNDKLSQPAQGAAYFTAKTYLDQLAGSLGLAFDYARIDKEPEFEITKPYDWNRSSLVTDRATGNYIGVIGEFSAPARRKLKLPVHSAGFELMLKPLQESVVSKREYRPLARFPRVSQDITFKIAKDFAFGEVASALDGATATACTEHGYRAQTAVLDIYHKDRSPHKHITFRLTVHHPEKTLVTDEVTKFVDTVVAAVEAKLDIKRV